MVTKRDEIAAELKRLHEDVLYTEKSHFAANDRLRRVHYWLGGTATTGSVVAAATIVDDHPMAAAVAALISALAAGVMTFMKPADMAHAHLSAGRKLNALRVEIRQVRQLDMAAETEDDLAGWRQSAADFATRKATVDQDSPAISEGPFQRGRRKILRGDFEHDA